MDIYILRHGAAEVKDPQKYPDDSVRPLTSDGVKKMRKEVRGMKALGLEFDLIVTSPYRRAKHTAEIVKKVLKSPAPFIHSKNLQPEASAKNLMKELNRKYARRKSVLLVGHEPFLGGLISVLLGGFGDMSFELKKGGLCKLSASLFTYERCATLEWFLTPKQLIKMR